ncbi:CHAT domain-containing protein [Pseudanabaena yagii]|uniref:CHAT domain-containing protein n=1 Tax=Pseudanabaena yagii GIHE-NHR1 TaxID=2722753 RepID=A0ABX1LPA1_9CYAN|nr:CHAT domain-containing protein [Pseudanabaena yagii]NMF57336.1 CHAT domain-containing protein [Pseudanabaena yagii GIHE-NHR1]
MVVAANPLGSSPLKLDHEVKTIQEALRRSRKRDNFEVEYRLAATPSELRRALLDLEPHVLHFSGHGSGEQGLLFVSDESASAIYRSEGGEVRSRSTNNNDEIKFVPAKPLANLLQLCEEHLECVVLNACYSDVQGDAIAANILFTIGMRDVVEDNVAIKFSQGFYDAIGSGKSYEEAFKWGKVAIEFDLANEEATKILILRKKGETIKVVENENLQSLGMKKNILKGIRDIKLLNSSRLTLIKKIRTYLSQSNKFKLIIGLIIILPIPFVLIYIYAQQYQNDRFLFAEIEKIENLKLANKYKECVEQNNSIFVNSSYDQIARLIKKECQAGMLQEDKSKIIQSQEMVKNGKLTDAFLLITTISSNSVVYPESKKLIDKWSLTILDNATKQYQEEGKLNESLNLLQLIATNNDDMRNKSQELSSKWQIEWKSNEKLINEANRAIDEGRLDDAKNIARNVSTIFWQEKADIIFQKSNSGSNPIKTLPSSSPTPTLPNNTKIDLPPINIGK